MKKKRSVFEICLSCEFAVEAAYVMAVVIFSLAIIMRHAYLMRDEVISAFVTDTACIDGVYTEDKWLKEEGTVKAEKTAAERLSAIGRLKDESVGVMREEGYLGGLTGDTVTASCTRDNRKIEIKVRDPENYMRANSLLEVFK